MANNDDKGLKGGSCNVTACRAPGAMYFNKSTRAYYCEDCAREINWPGGRADCMALYGRPLLCELDEVTTVDFNKLAVSIYEQNKAVGWWDNPDRCLYECLQLVSTEVAEATEGERKDLMDDHLPARKMGEVELADALIRALDLGGRLGLEYEPRDRPHYAHTYGDKSVAALHLAINRDVIELADSLAADYRKWTRPRHWSRLLDTIVAVAESLGYDIEGAMVEKLAYNKTRADHKRENREKEGGKKF